MSTPPVPDDLWNRIALLLPEKPSKPTVVHVSPITPP
jgi:hypothetical protein